MHMESKTASTARYVICGVALLTVFGLGFFIDRIVDHFPFRDWDLTQPQAVLIGALASGIFLVSAAWIAFHGQEQNRIDERQRHEDLLRAQRHQWTATQKATSALKYRDEVRTIYLVELQMQEKLVDLARENWNRVRDNDTERAAKAYEQYHKLYDEEFLLTSTRGLVETSEINATIRSLRAAHFELCHLEPVGTAEEQEKQGSALSGFRELSALQVLMREHLDSLLPDGELPE